MDPTNTTPSHAALRQWVREWFSRSGVLPVLRRWESASSPAQLSREEHHWVKQRLGEAGFLAIVAGPGPHLARVPAPNMWTECGIPPDKVDVFHTYVVTEERARINLQGATEGTFAGTMIGLAPVLHFGQPWLLASPCLVDDFVLGRKHLALAITEPGGGSDVASVSTQAVRLSDGSGWYVSGTKKFITGSIFADAFTTLVRMADTKQLSMLLIERGPGITVSYVPTAWGVGGLTGLIVFENALVPARNLLGAEGEGLRITLQNFNSERLGICANVIGVSRRVMEECLEFCAVRGLHEKEGVRLKLADMVSELARVDAWFLKLAHRYEHFPAPPPNSKQTRYELRNEAMGGEIALLKYRTTRMSQVVAENGMDIFGFHSLSWAEDDGGNYNPAAGMGRLFRQFKVLAIGGGSEELMLDLGVRQAMRAFPRNARL